MIESAFFPYLKWFVLGPYILHQLQKLFSWKDQVGGDGGLRGSKRSKVLIWMQDIAFQCLYIASQYVIQ